IAAVSKCMNHDIAHARCAGDPRQSHQVKTMAVHTSIRYQPQQMKPMMLRTSERLFQNVVSLQLSIGNGLVNSRQILIDDSSRTQIKMTDLRVSHLPFWQSNVEAAGTQPARWVLAIQLIMERRLS